MKYRNKFRLSHLKLIAKNSIMTLVKGDVPTYVTTDIMNRLNKGEHEITLTMCGDINHKSLVDYLNEFHRTKAQPRKLEFLHYAFLFTSESIKQCLGKFSDIDIEILEISDTDKRVIIKLREKGKSKDEK